MQERVQKALYAAIDEVNEMQPPGERLEKSPDTALAGPNSILSSLGLVNLVVAVEEQIYEELEAEIGLGDVVASGETQHYETVAALTAFITSKL